MPSLVVHLLIPPLVLLATQRFSPKHVFLLLPFSLLSDLDFFIPPHRALLHSVFLVGACGLLAWHWAREGRRDRVDLALIAMFYLGSHSLMDLFVGGVTPLYPLSDETFFVDVQVLINTRTLETFPTFSPGTQAGPPEVSPLYEFFDGIQMGILSLALVAGGAMAWARARRVQRHVVVVAPEDRP